jgi:Spy/CpxP family protein refolding chaperone
MKKMVMVCLQIAVLAGLSSLAPAQTEVTVTAKPLTESDIALLRHDVQADKMDIITKTMQFTDAEAAGFWPVYRQYANEQHEIGDKEYRIIKDYATNYDQMTDAKAGELTRKFLDVEKTRGELRSKYLPQFEKVLTPKRAAKFMQVDRRLSLMIELELASDVPILQ